MSRGAEAFDAHYAEIYQARWPALKQALLREPEKVTLKNPFSRELQDYSLDEASLSPARALDVQDGERVADFCASPGGKLIAGLFAKPEVKAEWVANDLSPNRVARLRAVLHDCLPADRVHQVRVYQGDAARWGLKYKEQFDKVLVDAPCSGERHLLHSRKELERWTVKSSRRLAIRQHALVCAALDCVKPGGVVVYSTCSISPIENDGVIEKLHKSRKGQFAVRMDVSLPAEPTRFGAILLPDQAGCGPIYYSVLVKLEGADGDV